MLSDCRALTHLMITAVLEEGIVIMLLLQMGDTGPERPSNLPKFTQPGYVRASLLEARVGAWIPPADPFPLPLPFELPQVPPALTSGPI